MQLDPKAKIALGAVTFAFEVSFRILEVQALITDRALSSGGDKASRARQQDYGSGWDHGKSIWFLARCPSYGEDHVT